MQVLESYTIPYLDEPVRLSDLPSGTLITLPTRSGMKKAVKKGRILVNGHKGHTSNILRGGEELKVLAAEEAPAKTEVSIPISVLAEDDYLALVNKPGGLVVSGNKARTLERALPAVLTPSAEKDALAKPQAIHRLDYPTSGVVLVGKTTNAVVQLNQLFEKREVFKTYFAIVVGKPDVEGSISLPVDDKQAETLFSVKETVASERFGALSLVELHPTTGRRHQLRKHLAHMGCPILGDKEYGTEGLILHGKGLFLHAFALRFLHPITQKVVKVEAPFPKKFGKLFSSCS